MESGSLARKTTAIDEVAVTDRVAQGIPHEEVKAPDLPAHPWPATPAEWSTLRRPASEDWFSLAERPGWLRPRGGQSPSSRHDVSLAGRRITAQTADFEAVLDFSPTSFRQMAGIMAYYNTRDWHYLRVTHSTELGVCADVTNCDRGRVSVTTPQIPVSGPVTLSASLDAGQLRFTFDGRPHPGVFDATILSDEYATEWLDGVAQAWGFTGAFFAVAAHDLTGSRIPAAFTLPLSGR